MKIGEEIAGELKSSNELMQEGFRHAYKAGELIQEVKALCETEEKLKEWFRVNCKGVKWGQAEGALSFYNNKKAQVSASFEEDKNG